MRRNLKFFLFSVLFLLLFANCGGDEPNNGGQKRQNGYLVYNEFLISVSGNDATIEQYTGNETSVTIPSTIQDYVNDEPVTYIVKKIAPRSFKGKDMNSISMPSSLTSIGNEAFSDCANLASVNLPSSLTAIGNEAFCNCTNLASVSMPSSLQSIGSRAFVNTALKNLIIPSRMTEIGAEAFSNLPLLEVNIQGVSNIGEKAFAQCRQLSKVTITNEIKNIQPYAFYECANLMTVSLASTLESIGDYAFGRTAIKEVSLPTANLGKQVFYETSLQTLHIGNNATQIPNKFMYECIGAYSLSSLTKLTFSEGIKEIGVEAFHDCTHLQDLDIPNSVITIKDSAFKNIISLKNIIFGSNLQLIDNNAFNGCSYLETCRFKGLIPPTINGGSTLAYYPVHTVIYVPQGSLQAYKNALNGHIAYNCTIIGY